MKQAKDTSEEYEYYTPQEIEALDKYQDFTENYFDDDELYDIIIKYKYDDEKIKNELSDMLRGVKRGDEYKWFEEYEKVKQERSVRGDSKHTKHNRRDKSSSENS